MKDALTHVVPDLIQKGHAMVAFPFSTFVPAVFEGLSRLMTEPKEYRDQWLFDLASKGDPDDGLVDSNAKTTVVAGEKYDDKYYFHYRPWLPWLLEERGVDIERYRDWLTACESLFNRCRAQIGAITERMDLEMPGHRFAEGTRVCENLHVLRVLWYRNPVKTPDDEELLAQEHTDRDFLTLHVAENYPGLLVRDRSGKASLVPAKHDLAIVFPGKKAQLMTGGRIVDDVTSRNANIDGGTLVAMPHAVIDTRGRDQNRLSTVFFSHTPNPIPQKKPKVG